MKLSVCIMKFVVFDMIMLGCLSVCRWQLTVVIYRKLTEFTTKFWLKPINKLRSDKYTYFDLNNIEDSALRSLVAQSIVYARNNGVEFTLEVKDIITRLPIDLLDLVRIMSVLLNNAVEGSADSYKKQMEVAVIKMETETVIVIQNSCKVTMTPSGDLFALGFSTKGRNRGVGLNNVKELLDKYNNIILEQRWKAVHLDKSLDLRGNLNESFNFRRCY